MENKKDKPFLQAFNFIKGLMNGKDKFMFVFLSILMIIKAFAIVTIVPAFACIISKMIGSSCDIFGFRFAKSMGFSTLVFICGAVVMLALVINTFITVVIKKYAVYMSGKVNSEVFNKLMVPRKNLKYKQSKEDVLKISSRASQNTQRIIEKLFLKLIMPAILALMTFVIIIRIDFVSSLILLCGFVIVGVSGFLKMRLSVKSDNEIDRVKNLISKHYEDSVDNIPLMLVEQSYFHEQTILDRYNKEYLRVLDEKSHVLSWQRLLTCLIECLIVCIAIVVAFIRIGADAVNIADMIIMVTYAGQIFIPLDNVGMICEYLKKNVLELNEVSILDVDKEDLMQDEEGYEIYDLPHDVIIDNIRMKNLVVNFDGQTKKYPNIEFNSHLINVIKGDTKSGKTTLLEILLGTKEYLEGEIIINNRYKIDSLYGDYDDISVSMQNPMIFDRTISENICYPDNVITRKHNYYMNRLDVFNLRDGEKEGNLTIKDLTLEDKHRISLVRCLSKEVSVYIFDDPTEHLNPDQVRVFIEELERLKDKSMIIIVSKDKKILNIADNVIEL